MVSEESGKNRRMIAVMDGCSSGKDSHFASTLIGKLLRKLAKQEAYFEYARKETVSLAEHLERLSLQLFDELSILFNQLDLRSDEVLSTLILAVVDTQFAQAEIVVVGDGVIHLNGRTIEFENDNKPDYMGYHLNMDRHLWYQTRTQRLTVDRIVDLTISTDGIHTFKPFDVEVYDQLSAEVIVNKFFVDKSDLDNSNMLKKVLVELRTVYGLTPSDDLTMIRVVNEHFANQVL